MAMLCFVTSIVIAQSRAVTGTVKTESGEPIPNASVIIRGTNTGTTTQEDGTFSISVPSVAKDLIISAVGYTTKNVTIGSASALTIILATSGSSLDEVVVVGYGVQQKKAFTGAASKIDADKFKSLMVPSVDKELSGRATGVQVTNAGGGINSPARIRIRGIQSLTGNNDPLIVVDGVPIISGNAAAVGNSNSLGDINPADIESIDVLKDGSSTAIYGSRAAAGVILITTKKGVKGRSKITYETTLGFTSPLKTFDLLNASEFKTIANEKLTNAGLAVRAGTNASADTSDTDWQAEVMNRNAFVQGHTVSLQGGSDKVGYYFSLNYTNQKGNIISNQNKSYRIRMNLDYEVNKFFKIGNSLSASRQEDFGQNEGANSLGGSIASTLRLLPNVSPYNSATGSGYNIMYPTSNQMGVGPNGGTIDDNFSNVVYTLRNDKYYSDKYRILDNLYGELAPIKGLKIRSQIGIDMLNDYSYLGLTPFHGDSYGKGENYNANQNWLRLLWTNYFNYNLSIDKHNIFLTGGNEVQKTTYKYFSADMITISDPIFIGKNIFSGTSGSGGTNTIGGNFDNTGFTSLFARLNYDFDNKYFLQGTIRRDGQSSLAPNKRFGVFPGISAGWRASQESFWTNSGLRDVVNELKLKASYSKVGNALSGYRYLTTFVASPYATFGGIIPDIVGNPDLQWETNDKYNAGIEMGFFNNRFTITADYFYNNVNNLVLDVPQPLSAGLVGSLDLNGGTIAQNIATMTNKGLELAINADLVKKRDFTWDINVNYTSIRNNVTSLFDVGGKPVASISHGAYNITRVGDPYGIIYGFRNAGVNSFNGNPMWYKSDGTLVQYNLTNTLTSGTNVGNFYVADATNGTLGAQTTGPGTADKVKLGESMPRWFGAVTNSFNYKGVGLEVMFRYSGGNMIMNYTRQEALSNMSFQNNGKEILNRWQKSGDVTDVPKLYYGLAANINSTSNASSRWVEKGDFLRLQNIILSYNIKPDVITGLTNEYVKSIRLYIQAQNVHVWTKYKGADPENITSLGLDNAYAPQIRNISFGLNVGF